MSAPPLRAETGAERIAAERERQVSEEGYDAEHDDGHDDGSLAMAAVCYAACAAGERIYAMDEYASQFRFSDPWPWGDGSDARPHDGNVPKDPTDEEGLRLLVKAGALIAAEIDRLLRRSAKAVEKSKKSRKKK